MIERELKRQLDLLFAGQRELQSGLEKLAKRVAEFDGLVDLSPDFKYAYFEGVIEAGDDWQVYVTDPGGERRELQPRYDLANHSPDGFSWGYVGSGPSQLAIAMLAHHFWHECDAHDDSAKATRLAGQFMTECVAVLPKGKSWAYTSNDIDDWLSDIGEL